jgi:hypothetical protein
MLAGVTVVVKLMATLTKARVPAKPRKYGSFPTLSQAAHVNIRMLLFPKMFARTSQGQKGI